MKRDEIIRKLREHRKEWQQMGVKRLALFGSVAREENRPESDVDLLVEFASPPGFRGYMNLKFYLEDLLGTKVDLVMQTALQPWARPIVEKEMIDVS